ncbi:hypothetical protein GOBAR_AA27361 [Gossypium barbadense]|uniref:Uncharacterized protein n=1 Tax=Gossypium barbadense TaxID=3634 RepID=A0A2P5WQI3_GOSBA|nr:hypothetical protein GOBAR_AA27361 [Gossypium barbadense]
MQVKEERNTETALKNQQVPIQRLQTQIGQLTKLISERPQGCLLSNTESNPREQLNTITIQDEEGLVAPEPELRQETMVSKGKGEVDHNDQKQVNSHFVWVMKQSLFKLKTGSKSAHEPCSSNNEGPIYEERRLQVEKLDEWLTHKPKPCLDELNIPPNQLKVGDKVLLDAEDPRIATSKSNGEIPLTVLNIFPYRTVKVIHPKFGTFKVNNTRLKPYFDKTDSREEQCKLLTPP